MTEGSIINMSTQEIHRLKMVEQVTQKKLTQKEAAVKLKLSTRQIKRLCKRYREQDAAGLVSLKRGRQSNRTHTSEFKEEVLRLVKTHYMDFKPTFASEKLWQLHQLKINRETLRQWMIEAHIWLGKKRKKCKVFQCRARRAKIGELVQIDGSDHPWFEARGSRCCLLLFVDDATSKIMMARFEKSETTAGYFKAVKDYLKIHGKPKAWYSDRDSVFKLNQSYVPEGAITQFARAMDMLDIEVIWAETPQAKGRVERMNATLQDRLVKELRLRNINDMESGNQYLPEFIEKFNQQFGVEPVSEINAHEQIDLSNIDEILSFHHERKLSKNLELSFNNTLYQIQSNQPSYAMRRATVKIIETLEGEIRIYYKGKTLSYKCYKKDLRKRAGITASKQINTTVNQIAIKRKKPAANHPWRNVLNPKKLSEQRA
jgi:hypothetical protein